MNVNALDIYYGKYPQAGGATTQANFADEGGYQIDLSNMTIQEIQD